MISPSARRTMLVLAIVGTAASSAADPMDSDERKCPSEVRGVRVASSRIRDGVAFTFTVAKPTQLSGLRSLLRDAAMIIEHDSRLAALHPDPDVMPMSDGDGAVPALDISIRNTPTGAIVSVRPEEPTHVALLQHNARNFELFWSSHTCVDTPKLARPTITSAKAVALSPHRLARSTAAPGEAPWRAP
jgi:hypothetical protein